MNLAYVHRLLIAADQQPDAYLQVLGWRADCEVRLMAEAGLVEATLNDGGNESFTSINHLTDLGRTFLRAFKDLPIPTGPRPARIEGMAGEWNLNP
jgi:hypothetical protein